MSSILTPLDRRMNTLRFSGSNRSSSGQIPRHGTSLRIRSCAQSNGVPTRSIITRTFSCQRRLRRIQSVQAFSAVVHSQPTNSPPVSPR